MTLVAAASVPEPLRITLSDLRSSDAKGKWWLVGAAWAGDPLVDSSAPALQVKDTSSDAKLAKLARAQGMNTDIRKGVFTVLMSSEVSRGFGEGIDRPSSLYSCCIRVT